MNKVAIITPFFNSYSSFVNTYNSVVAQSHEDWLWYVVDDCSTPEQSRLLSELIGYSDKIILIRNETNVGAGLSRNRALDLLSNEFSFLTFIDSDDVWDDDFLKQYLSCFRIFDVDVLYGGYRRKSAHKCDIFLPTKINDFNNILYGCDISCLSTVIRLPHDSNFNYRFGNIKARNDLVFFASLLRDFVAFPVPLVLATYHLSDNSLSSNKYKLLYYQFLVNFRFFNNGFFISSLNCIKWIFFGLKKYSGRLGSTNLRN